ncbi:MAG TPA: putative baseplate assembly protein [Pyrinomonadaceae bacterium]|nr:putative baseplate assembly protein [Pyrinomonadaceae bacterium]
MTLKCLDERRRHLVRDQAEGGLNGIDYIEIVEGTQQRLLCVHFFGELPSLVRANVRIEGGRRVRDIKVVDVEPHESDDPEHQDCLRIQLDRAGDFSCYKVCLYEVDDEGLTTEEFLKGFDPRYVCAEFSFKGECPSDLDCKNESVCLPEVTPAPEINYLAKDYASFRQLIFDRLSLLLPDWQERHVPDIGVALVEVLAYTGDYLSYYQDAVATEAYLDTARQRISVRRHARLVDYYIHEGCNARAWITVDTRDDLNEPTLTYRDIYFTAGPDDTDAIVFEPLVSDPNAPIQLFKAHNEILFYTWGNEECCLPKGSTSATLRDEWIVVKPAKPEPQPEYEQKGKYKKGYYPEPEPEPPPPPVRKLQLKVGDVLIFEEVIGPKTGSPNDADQTRRHVVRLTKVTPVEDPLVKEKPTDPEAQTKDVEAKYSEEEPQDSDEKLPIPLVEIEWALEDALPFHMCLSARLPVPADPVKKKEKKPGDVEEKKPCELVTQISVARGNVILVDHGRTISSPEYLGQVEQQSILGECSCETSVMDLTTTPKSFRPVFQQGPLTFSERVDWTAPAASSVKQDPRNALPQIHSLIGLPAKCETTPGQQKPDVLPDINPDDEQWRWQSRGDLLGSGGLDRDFVVEIDNDGRAHLRFGDGELGRQPQACMIFHALYRTGSGPSGNVGAGVITTIGWRNNRNVSGLTLSARNPLPATGGVSQEPMSEARLFAPKAFLKQLERAITPDDYARLAERSPGRKVQRAGASLRWTGSWYAAEVSIDPFGSESADPELFKRIKGYLHRYRRMGHDVEVELARYVPLKIEMQVCVKPHYLRGHVEAALLEIFSGRMLSDGRLGFFHPDNLTFGEGIYLSKLVAAAQAIAGVESVRITKLERLGEGDRGELDEGILELGPLEVPQLDNDPNFPERGTLKITMRGGR